MFKTLAKFLIPILLLVVLFLPTFSQAALINCGNTTFDSDLEDPTNSLSNKATIDNPCDFKDFVETLNGIINWIISIAGIIFTLTLVYAGFLYMLSGDNPGKKTEAVDMMWNTLKGFLFILTAWLIIYTILNVLIPENSVYRGSIFKFIGTGN